MGNGDARRHVPALPPVGGNAAGAAYCHHYLVTENCWPYCAAIAEIHRKWGCKMILKEPYARAA